MTEKIDNWLIAPVSQCVLYLTDEIMYSGLVRRGLVAMSGMLPFFVLANERLENAGIDTAPLKKLASDYLSWEHTAKEHIDSDFSTVYRHSLIGLWCVVETAIEDSVLLILEKSPMAEELLSKAGYKAKQTSLKELSREQLHSVYSGLEKQSRNRGGVAEAWLDLLAALDVKFSLSDEVISTLAEANEVRNCILHRGGEIDARAASKAPGLVSMIGSRVEVGEKRYLRYYNAIGQFATAMIGGVTSSCHCTWKSADR